MTAAQAARILRLSEATIHAYAADLGGVVMDGRLWIPRSALTPIREQAS